MSLCVQKITRLPSLRFLAHLNRFRSVKCANAHATLQKSNWSETDIYRHNRLPVLLIFLRRDRRPRAVRAFACCTEQEPTPSAFPTIRKLDNKDKRIHSTSRYYY
jgi:hypothetical protein